MRGRCERARAVRGNCKGKMSVDGNRWGNSQTQVWIVVKLKAIKYKGELFCYLSSYTYHQAFPICAAQDVIPHALSHRVFESSCHVMSSCHRVISSIRVESSAIPYPVTEYLVDKPRRQITNIGGDYQLLPQQRG